MTIAPRVVGILVCLTLAACGSVPDDGPSAGPTGAVASPTPTEAVASSAPTDEGPTAAPTEAEACAEEERPPLQAGSHLIGDAEPPQPYSSTPPTSGWHSSGALDVTIHDGGDPLSEPEQVSVLEADGVVVTYRDLPDDGVAALEQLVRDDYDGRIAVTPYDELEPGEVALTAWGVLQRCARLELDSVRAFAEAHLGDGVTPGH
jgi:hypothetical protein